MSAHGMDRVGRAPRRHGAAFALIVAAAAGVAAAGSTWPGEFDATLEAPPAPEPAALAAAIRDYFRTVARLEAIAPDALVRDEAAQRQWLDLYWKLGRAIDERRELGDLSEFGLVALEDGSYRIDLGRYPQWAPLDKMLGMFGDPEQLDFHVPGLRARGFRDRDIGDLRAYVTANSLRRATRLANLPLNRSFARFVRQRVQAGGSVSKEEFLSYVYQRELNFERAQRRWALGLLDALDRQRQRILLSSRRELGGWKVLAPSDLDAAMRNHLETALTPDIERRLEIEAQETR